MSMENVSYFSDDELLTRRQPDGKVESGYESDTAVMIHNLESSIFGKVPEKHFTQLTDKQRDYLRAVNKAVSVVRGRRRKYMSRSKSPPIAEQPSIGKIRINAAREFDIETPSGTHVRLMMIEFEVLRSVISNFLANRSNVHFCCCGEVHIHPKPQHANCFLFQWRCVFLELELTVDDMLWIVQVAPKALQHYRSVHKDFDFPSAYHQSVGGTPSDIRMLPIIEYVSADERPVSHLSTSGCVWIVIPRSGALRFTYNELLMLSQILSFAAKTEGSASIDHIHLEKMDTYACQFYRLIVEYDMTYICFVMTRHIQTLAASVEFAANCMKSRKKGHDPSDRVKVEGRVEETTGVCITETQVPQSPANVPQSPIG